MLKERLKSSPRAVQHRFARRRASRKVFIDCGANTCTVLRSFIAKLPDFEFFAFEPQPELRDAGEEIARDHPTVTFISKAVWIRDEDLEFFLATKWGPNHRGASTLLHGHADFAKIDYSTPLRVTAIDFSRWLGENFTADDYLIVKMDIEGAEYDVLEKMLADGTLSLVDELKVEFHQPMNNEISEERHRRLLDTEL